MQQTMAENRKPSGKGVPSSKPAVAQPDWANGLRNIYDSVVNEPLPDDMLKLLASLDDDGDE